MAKNKTATAPETTETTKKPRWVVCTNTSRGVYYGELREEPVNRGVVRLYNMRHCFTWKCFQEAKGVWGLAVKGPAPGSQVGPTVPFFTISSDAQYADCTDEAVKNWEAATW